MKKKPWSYLNSLKIIQNVSVSLFCIFSFLLSFCLLSSSPSPPYSLFTSVPFLRIAFRLYSYQEIRLDYKKYCNTNPYLLINMNK